mgnify:FL=1
MSDRTSLFSRWTTILRIIAVGIPILGAIPTAANIYYGWKHDVPWWEVPARLEQARLWEKNGECKVGYRALSTGTTTVVQVGSCPTTGDISLKVAAEDRDPVYQWIAFKSLRKPGETSSFMDHLIPPVRAATPSALRAEKPIRLSQATSQVLCQSKEGANIVRIISENNRCFREMFSPFKGRVEKREEVPCDTACQVPKKS